jgi:electron transfer flavoprotein beta subunit
MEIVVCIKQVPDTETKINLLDDASGIVTEGIKYVLNPYDEYAVEEALRLKERFGGTVTLVCVGPERAIEAIRMALAMGADKAIHVVVDKAEHLDSLAVGQLTAAAVKQVPYDIILCGKQAVDYDWAQAPQILAELLGLPQATVINKLEIADDGKSVTAYRKVEGGAREVLELSLPAVIAAEKDLNQPRYPSLPGIMKAKRKEVKKLSPAELGVELAAISADAARVKVHRYSLPPLKPPGRKLEGELEEVTRNLVRLLREEAKVI